MYCKTCRYIYLLKRKYCKVLEASIMNFITDHKVTKDSVICSYICVFKGNFSLQKLRVLSCFC